MTTQRISGSELKKGLVVFVDRVPVTLIGDSKPIYSDGLYLGHFAAAEWTAKDGKTVWGPIAIEPNKRYRLVVAQVQLDLLGELT